MTPRPAAIGLVVADLAASIAFYRLLGLAFPADIDETAGHVECQLGGGIRLLLDTRETVAAFLPGWTAPTGSPRGSLAFEFDSPAEVDATYRQLTEAGHHGHKEPWDAFWGQRYALLLDPDGNGVDLYAALPAAT